MSNENMETPRGFSKKPLIIIAAAVVIAGGGAAAAVTAVNYSNSPARLITLAQKFLDDADYEKAIIEFDRVLTVDPLNVDAYVGKAEALEALGRTDEAIKVLEQALEAVRDSAGADELDRLQRLLDELNGAVVVESTAEATDTAEAPETAESEQPAQTDGVYVLTSLYRDLGDGDYVSEYYDEDGYWHYETYGKEDSEDVFEYTDVSVDRVFRGDVNLIMCPVYFEDKSSTNGTVNYHAISDYGEPGVLSEYYYSYYPESDEEADESQDYYTYATDENGWIILDSGTTYTYEFDSEGRPVIKTWESKQKNLVKYVVEYEYGENGLLSHFSEYRDDVGLVIEERYDEWGNATYNMRKTVRWNNQSTPTVTSESTASKTYSYTFGENGAPVSAVVSSDSINKRVRNGETVTNNNSTSYTETYTYEKLEAAQPSHTPEAEDTQPVKPDGVYVLTSRNTDNEIFEFYDEDGNWRYEYGNSEKVIDEEWDVKVDRVFRGDVNLVMCPVYSEYRRYSDDGTLERHIMRDYREPGVISCYDSGMEGDEEEYWSSTYATDENGWAILDDYQEYTYEFDSEGRPVRKLCGDRVTEYEYGENGLLSHVSEYSDDRVLVSEERFDEWGNRTYYYDRSTSNIGMITTSREYSYNYTFGENGVPVSAVVFTKMTTVYEDSGETKTHTGSGELQTYTYEKVQ